MTWLLLRELALWWAAATAVLTALLAVVVAVQSTGRWTRRLRVRDERGASTGPADAAPARTSPRILRVRGLRPDA